MAHRLQRLLKHSDQAPGAYFGSGLSFEHLVVPNNSAGPLARAHCAAAHAQDDGGRVDHEVPTVSRSQTLVAMAAGRGGTPPGRASPGSVSASRRNRIAAATCAREARYAAFERCYGSVLGYHTPPRHRAGACLTCDAERATGLYLIHINTYMCMYMCVCVCVCVCVYNHI
jgi:hypothetical protein